MKYSALIGNPVEHSIAPYLFDLITRKMNLEYAHLKINVPHSSDLKKYIEAMKQLEFVGFNITCPYKVDMFNILSDSELDDEAKKIHSINSVVIKDNYLKGYNTDGKAAMLSIEKFYKISADDNVVILGSGGVAYPILYEILERTKNIVVFNENINDAVKMCSIIKSSVNCHDFSNEEIFIKELNKASVIINATSVGMFPNSNDSLISKKIFSKLDKKQRCYFDVIFNPWETQFLKNVKGQNSICISGGYMLIFQAILVLSLWLNNPVELSNNDIDDIVIKLKMFLKENYD